MTSILRSALAFLFLFIQVSYAAEDMPDVFRSTDFPLPRFASLSSDKAYARAGPGKQYPILWAFEKKNYPVEITLEYENWRKIKDHAGEEGWVHLSLLSGRRYGYVRSTVPVSVLEEPEAESRIVAIYEPGVIGRLDTCEDQFCRMRAGGYKGWVQRKSIWGVYENENLN